MALTTYLISGEDEFLVAAKANEVIGRLVPSEQQAFGLEVVDGRVDGAGAAGEAVSRVISSMRTAAFPGFEKAVWFKDVNFLTDNPIARSDSVKAKLEQLSSLIKAAGSLPRQALVLTTTRIDKRLSIYRVCKAAGEVHEFGLSEKSYEQERSASDFAQQAFRKAGLNATHDAVMAFLERVGTDTRQIVNEIEKLGLFLGGRREVQLADIAAVVSSSRSALVWDLADAAGVRQLDRALSVMRQLLFQRESPMALIIALESRFRDLDLYREAIDNGWLTERRGYRDRSTWEWRDVDPETDAGLSDGLGKDPRTTHPYRVGILASQAKLFSKEEIRRGRTALVNAHEKLVTSSQDPSIVLETTLVRLLGRGRRSGLPEASL